MKEGNRVLPKRSHGLHSNWDKVMGVRDLSVVSLFLLAAMSATRPGPNMVIWMLEAAIVSQHMASQMRRRRWAQGVMVIPSGHLTLEWDSPSGSSTDGMLALARDCLMMVFNWL